MARGFFSWVIERLGHLPIEGTIFSHRDDQVEGILGELRRLEDHLTTADARQNQSKVEELIAEVCRNSVDLESLISRVKSKRRGSISNKLKRYGCIQDDCRALHDEFDSKIHVIKARISELNTCLVSPGEGSSSARANDHLRLYYSHVREEDIVGLEGDIEDLVGHLVNDDDSNHSYRVVTIYGLPCAGKTTLATKIYNHLTVRSHFAAFAWPSISKQPLSQDIFRGILIELIPEEKDQIKSMSHEKICNRLLEVLRNKRCLVVLDEIWSTDDWDCLRLVFPIEKMRSKLLLTSCRKEVAMHIDPQGLLHRLQMRDSVVWELFQKKAFTRRNLADPRDMNKMEKLGRSMITCCRGFPIAGIMLGELLATNQTWIVWQIVHQFVESNLRGTMAKDREPLDMFPLSDAALASYPFRRCFLYLAHLPKDSEIEAEKLYQLWMAESLIYPENQFVAERYLNDLARRCMVKVQLEESTRRIKSCRLSEFFREHYLSKAKEENFLKVIDLGSDDKEEDLVISFPTSSSSSSEEPRLVICLRDLSNLDKYVPPKQETARHLHSVLFSLPRDIMRSSISHAVQSHLGDFENVTVLDLGGLVFSKLDESLGKLIQLRYLGLRRTVFHQLPSSIQHMKQLQTLDVWDDDTQFASISIPNFLHKLTGLRHLYLRRLSWSGNERGKMQLDGLSQLEILGNFDSRVFNVEDLFSLYNLLNLGAIVSKKSDLKRFTEYLQDIQSNRLRHLALTIKHCDLYSEQGLDLLSKVLACGKLHELRIEGRTGKLPEYSSNFSKSLTNLTLESSELMDDPMATLEQLPNLRSLSLRWNAYVGEKMLFSALGFPHLRNLQLWRLRNLKTWTVEDGAMSNLSSLQIISCPNLEKVPDGVESVKFLQELVIQRMPESFTKRLQGADGKGGEDFRKVQHVCSIKLKDYDRDIGMYGANRMESKHDQETQENVIPLVKDVEDLFKISDPHKVVLNILKKSDLERLANYLQQDSSNRIQHLALAINHCDISSEKGLNHLRQVFMCPVLHELSIAGRTCKFPKYDLSLSKCLTKVTLENSELEDDPMATLQELPNLESLFLRWNAFVGEEMVCSASGFPQLKKLQILHLPNLEKWTVNEGAMRSLSSLDISSCPNLEMVPNGLKFVKSLQELVILHMPEAFTDNLAREDRDFYEVQHVHSVKILEYDRDIVAEYRKQVAVKLGDPKTLLDFDSCSFNVLYLFYLSNLEELGASLRNKFDLERFSEYLVDDAASKRLQKLELNIWVTSELESEEGVNLLCRVVGYCCPMLWKLEISGGINNKLLEYGPHSFSQGLTELVLDESGFKDDPMPTLEKLPKLQRLSLQRNSFEGVEMVCSAGGFPQLAHLQIYRLLNLQKWSVEKGAMPNLCDLLIWDCEKLKMVPDGLEFVKTLQTLTTRHMPKAFNDRLRVVDRKEGQDFYKVRHVPSIQFEGEL